MPVEASEALKITCDNPTCPGPPPTLQPDDRTGWLFLTAEVYGQQSHQHVFCSRRCLGQAAPQVAKASA